MLTPSGLATGAQPYNQVAPFPSNTPITLAELKAWLKITNNAEDALLTMIIAGVTASAEKWTKREFITKSFETFRDVFGDLGENPRAVGYPPQMPCGNGMQLPITLRRSKLQTVTSIEYYLNGVLTAWSSSNYYLIKKDAWSQIFPVAGADYPDHDERFQAIRIVFTAGYGADSSAIPQDLRTALLMHAASVYVNRGDCDDGGGDCSCATAPGKALAIYNQYRILDFVG